MTLNIYKNFKLWSLFFLYTAGVSSFVEFILLPLFLKQFYGGHGLLNSSFDSYYFHHLAVALANKIHHQGWSAWELRPGGQGPAGIAAVFYFFIWPDPRVLIPLSAAMHASAALILVKLLDIFVKNQARAVLCVLPFLMFPSNLLWTAQVHKDCYSILGVLLILYSIVSASRPKNLQDRYWYLIIFRSMVFFSAGTLLIWIVRPYMLSIVQPIVGLLLFILFLLYLISAFKQEISWQKISLITISLLMTGYVLRSLKSNIDFENYNENLVVLNEKSLKNYEIVKVPAPLIISHPVVEKAMVLKAPSPEVVIPVLVVEKHAQVKMKVKESSSKSQKSGWWEFLMRHLFSAGDKTLEVQPKAVIPVPEVKKPAGYLAPLMKSVKRQVPPVEQKQVIQNDVIENYWVKSTWLPSFIDTKFHALAAERGGSRLGHPDAKSNIDAGIGFYSAKGLLLYLPRAAQIAFLSPFPNQWFGEGSRAANSLMRRISIFEMLITYFFLAFLPLAIWHWRKSIEIWIISTFCTYMLLIYGLVICNIGTLYRMRYAYITTLVALGIAGFITFINRLNKRASKRGHE